MERPTFITDEIYHVYNRGVEKRNVFVDQKDHFRFIHDIFEFNDSAPAMNMNYYFSSPARNSTGTSESLSPLSKKSRKPRDLLVEVLCFCMMPNHYHFLLRQKVDGGITEFMRKLGTGYTNYFNQKYTRVGPLFQGKFKAVHVIKESHLLYLPHYIHLNPLDLVIPEWREQKIRSPERALKFLESYRWSSYLDFIKKHNFPSLTQRSFLLQIYGSPTSIDYKREMREWLMDFRLEEMEGIALESTMEVGLP